jgi:hypothetical protein
LSLTEENAQDLEHQFREHKTELDLLTKTSTIDMWRSDLDEFIIALDDSDLKHQQKMEGKESFGENKKKATANDEEELGEWEWERPSNMKSSSSTNSKGAAKPTKPSKPSKQGKNNKNSKQEIKNQSETLQKDQMFSQLKQSAEYLPPSVAEEAELNGKINNRKHKRAESTEVASSAPVQVMGG